MRAGALMCCELWGGDGGPALDETATIEWACGPVGPAIP